MLTMIVADNQVSRVVKAVIAVNQTGKSGDGKIFVQPVSEAWQVRTGNSGAAVLDDI